MRQRRPPPAWCRQATSSPATDRRTMPRTWTTAIAASADDRTEPAPAGPAPRRPATQPPTAMPSEHHQHEQVGDGAAAVVVVSHGSSTWPRAGRPARRRASAGGRTDPDGPTRASPAVARQ